MWLRILKLRTPVFPMLNRLQQSHQRLSHLLRHLLRQ
jgi:hypothetical protein